MRLITDEDARRARAAIRLAEEVPVLDGDDDILWISSQGGLDPLDLSHQDGRLKLSCPECRAWALYRMGLGERCVEFSHEDVCSIGGVSAHRRGATGTKTDVSATTGDRVFPSKRLDVVQAGDP